MNSNKIIEKNESSIGKIALLSGLSLLVMAIIAPFANFYIIQNLIVPENSIATVNNILASEGLFRVGIFLLVIVAGLDILIAWGLYIIFKPLSKNLSLLTAWLRIIYTSLLLVALSSLIAIPQILNLSDSQLTSVPNIIQAQVMFSINTFYTLWDLGLFIFGLHLFILGYLVFKSIHFPKFLGFLVTIAGFGYIFDSIVKIILPTLSIEIAMFTFIGEVLLIFWLLALGIKELRKKSTSKSVKI